MSVAAEELESQAVKDGSLVELHQSEILHQLEALDLEGQIVILSKREGGLVECFVPFSLVDNEEVPVKEEWAASLVKQFGHVAATEGGSGQHSAITLGLIEGEPTLKIMDGFHRSSALKQRGEELVFATVKLTDWDSLYDFRIFTAKDHVHVRFSRVVQWIREAWSRTELSGVMTVEQAVLMYRFGTDGSKLGLDPSHVAAAKEWIQRKEDLWQMAAMTIHSHLKVAEHVDPRLVHAAREKTHGKALEAPTQSILKVFSEQLPDKFDFQQVVIRAAIAHNLKSPQVKALCLKVKQLDNIEVAEAYVQSIDWETWEPEYGETKKRELRRAHDLRHKGAAALDRAVKDIASVIERLDVTIKKGEEITPEMQERLREAHERVNGLMSSLGGLGIMLSSLRSSEAKPRTLVPPRSNKPLQTPRAPRVKTTAPPVTVSVTEQDLDTDNEPDFDPTEFTPSEPEETLDISGDESLEPLEDDKGVGHELQWDEDLEEDEEKNEESEEEYQRPTLPPVGEAAKHADPSKETAAEKKFKDGLRAYLNEQIGDFPPIRTRLDILRAEKVMLNESFSGPSYLAEDIREEIRSARRNLGDK